MHHMSRNSADINSKPAITTRSKEALFDQIFKLDAAPERTQMSPLTSKSPPRQRHSSKPAFNTSSLTKKHKVTAHDVGYDGVMHVQKPNNFLFPSSCTETTNNQLNKIGLVRMSDPEREKQAILEKQRSETETHFKPFEIQKGRPEET